MRQSSSSSVQPLPRFEASARSSCDRQDDYMLVGLPQQRIFLSTTCICACRPVEGSSVTLITASRCAQPRQVPMMSLSVPDPTPYVCTTQHVGTYVSPTTAGHPCTSQTTTPVVRMASAPWYNHSLLISSQGLHYPADGKTDRSDCTSSFIDPTRFPHKVSGAPFSQIVSYTKAQQSLG